MLGFDTTSPFRHWIIDDFVPRSVVNAALIEWPGQDWPHWHVYSDKYSRKLATKDISRLPPAASRIFERLAFLDVESITGIAGLFPDYTAYAAGMHWLPKGGRLGIHLDAAAHPATGWRRTLSACLYLTGPESGDLVLCDSEAKESRRIAPQPGRLVLFECTDSAYHGVPDIVTCEGGRKSIAGFYWSLGESVVHRTSAEFVL